MIDWHSHILPGMDDGSKSVEQSAELLGMLSEQGIRTVVATPHYYANDESVRDFLERRSKALLKLESELCGSFPEILLGAEVRFYHGISRMQELKGLCVQGSRLLLLEMPESTWTEYTVRELTELSGVREIKVVLAHIERYLGHQNAAIWERLRDSGIMMQANASFFNSIATRRKALSLLKNQKIHFIGSDCHNTVHRPPDIGRAYGIIQKKFSDEYVNQMSVYGYSMLKKTI